MIQLAKKGNSVVCVVIRSCPYIPFPVFFLIFIFFGNISLTWNVEVRCCVMQYSQKGWKRDKAWCVHTFCLYSRTASCDVFNFSPSGQASSELWLLFLLRDVNQQPRWDNGCTYKALRVCRFVFLSIYCCSRSPSRVLSQRYRRLDCGYVLQCVMSIRFCLYTSARLCLPSLVP